MGHISRFQIRHLFLDVKMWNAALIESGTVEMLTKVWCMRSYIPNEVFCQYHSLALKKIRLLREQIWKDVFEGIPMFLEQDTLPGWCTGPITMQQTQMFLWLLYLSEILFLCFTFQPCSPLEGIYGR